MAHSFRYPIRECENYDGDSFNLTLDLGFGLVLHRKCRLEGADTPELSGGTPRSKAAGRLARDKARRFVAMAMADEGAVFVSETYTGKFGRPLGDFVRVSDGKSLREFLFDGNYAVPYWGGAKQDIAPLHAANEALLVKRGEIE